MKTADEIIEKIAELSPEERQKVETYNALLKDSVVRNVHPADLLRQRLIFTVGAATGRFHWVAGEFFYLDGENSCDSFLTVRII